MRNSCLKRGDAIYQLKGTKNVDDPSRFTLFCAGNGSVDTFLLLECLEDGIELEIVKS